MNPVVRVFFIVVIVAAVIAVSFFSYVKLRHGILLLSRIEVVGCETVDAKHVVSLAGLTAGDSLLFLPTSAVKRRIENADPLIVVRGIDKRFPDTAVIRIRERSAVALVRSERTLAEASAEGYAVRDIPRDLDLPVISRFPGDISNGRYTDATLRDTLALFGELRTNDRALYDIISEISYAGDEAYVYPRHFRLTALIKNPASRGSLTKLQAILVMLREKRERATSIDLRFKDAVVK